jgi:cysteinyl-tRNA synthetase, unknown class
MIPDFVIFMLVMGSLAFAQDVESTDDNDASVVKMYSPAFLIDLHSADIDYPMLSKSPFTYIIIDPDVVSLSSDQLTQLRNDGKIVLAYMSVGEAEMSRDYWTSEWTPGVFPKFLEHVNQVSRDRYKVRFWMQEWQTVLTKYFRNHIVRKGYSGVYLDVVDAYAYFLARQLQPSAADDMVSLVATLRQTAQLINPDFLLFPNNAVELYGSVKYSRLIDGMVAEGIWYRDDRPLITINPTQTNFTLQFLRRARIDGKTILAADFPLSQENICDFYVKCTTEVFRCAVFNSRLNGAGRECR